MSPACCQNCLAIEKASLGKKVAKTLTCLSPPGFNSDEGAWIVNSTILTPPALAPPVWGVGVESSVEMVGT